MTELAGYALLIVGVIGAVVYDRLCIFHAWRWL